MGRRRASDASPSHKSKRLTAEEAAHRIDGLRHAYDEGYLSRDDFESLKRKIEINLQAD